MNVTTVSTGTTTHSSTTMNNTTYKIEMIDDEQLSIASDDDDDDVISSDGVSVYDDSDMVHMSIQDEVATQLAAAGPVGVAAAAAIASSKKRKRPHSFETNPSVRKRQQNRLLRKLRGIIYEFTGRVGKQAVVLVATPGKPNTSYKVFGAKPLEDVVRNLKNIVMEELETALAQQAPPPPTEDPTLFELPPLIIDGIPTPVEKMTQAQLRAFIPLMLKYSTGRGKPGWGRESTRPPWWPKELPWANVRMDARTEEEKQKISWTHALRKIVINCYKYHGREDLLPTFADEDDKVTQIVRQHTSDQGTSTVSTVTSSNNNQIGVLKINNNGTIIQNTQSVVQSNNNQSNQGATKIEIHTNTGNSNSSSAHQTTIGGTQYTQTVLSTIQNADGTVSLIQVDPNNPIITLPDGTTAQVQGVATLHQGEGGATIQTVQSLSDVNGHENMTVDLTEAQVGQDGQIYITADDGQGYPVSVSNMITVPVSASMYQSMIANIQQLHTNSDGTVCITPMQVDSNSQNNNLQYYSILSAPGNSNGVATPHMPPTHVGGRIVHTIAQTIASTVAPPRCQTFNSPSSLSNSSHQAHQQQSQHSVTKVFISNSNNTVGGDNRITTNNNSIIINCNSSNRSSINKNKNNNIICENNKNLSVKPINTNKISKRRKQILNKSYTKQVHKPELQLVDEIDLEKTTEIKIEKIEK
ncbi:DNA-binding protein Ewg isoform X2 [Episyrphus balteatus]|uniref:DNA-binding protein Ewg isoform X2 n=1 Tax=Episyrphus balteatus TaxID=286459 RepID=UPI0024859122|nr:DNA-binding protein Ewg isoform X2 [Episyrphus balteatus]